MQQIKKQSNAWNVHTSKTFSDLSFVNQAVTQSVESFIQCIKPFTINVQDNAVPFTIYYDGISKFLAYCQWN